MRFSIVVPNYNSGPVIERALTSLLQQRGQQQTQVIVADSCSQDVSRQIIEQFRPRLSDVLIEKDQGQADGLNKGFERANGDVFGGVCADDELLPGALEHVAEIFLARPDIDVVIGNCERIFPDGSTYVTPARSDTWAIIGVQNVVDQPSVFWRGALHRRLGRLDDSYTLAFDWDFWCRMRNAGARLAVTDRVLSRYFFTATNKSGNSGRQHVNESFRIVRTYGPRGGLVAYVFLFLYHAFDLPGCYDRPPTCTRIRAALFAASLIALRPIVGGKWLFSYNWHFASCQERGVRWW